MKIIWEPLFGGCLARGLEYPLPVVDNNKHFSKCYFYSLYMIAKTEKALAHDLIPASLCEGPVFYFMLSQ